MLKSFLRFHTFSFHTCHARSWIIDWLLIYQLNASSLWFGWHLSPIRHWQWSGINFKMQLLSCKPLYTYGIAITSNYLRQIDTSWWEGKGRVECGGCQNLPKLLRLPSQQMIVMWNLLSCDFEASSFGMQSIPWLIIKCNLNHSVDISICFKVLRSLRTKKKPEGRTTIKSCHQQKTPTWWSFACLITLLEPHECKQQTKNV